MSIRRGSMVTVKCENFRSENDAKPRFGTGIVQTSKRFPLKKKLIKEAMSKEFKKQNKKWK